MDNEQIKRIVVGLDLSAPSLVALEHAVRIAQREDAEIVLAHASEAPRTATVNDDGEPSSKLDEWLLSDVRRQREELARIADNLRAQHLNAAYAVIDDDPVPGVAVAANELDADLVVVGSRGHTGIARFLLGSVAERTIRLAEGDAMVARGSAPLGGYKRILVPTDFSPGAEHALRLALRLAADGGEVELFHCAMPSAMVSAMTPEYALPRPVSDILGEFEDTARTRADALVKRYRRPPIGLRAHIAPTVAPSGILERLDDEQSPWDLVVVGTHSRTGWRRFFLGSIAETVARHAPCSTIAVPAERPTKETQ